VIIKAQSLATTALSQVGMQGFSDDARTAIQKAPDYFVWWYTVKSVGLGVAVAALGFMIGRATAKRS